MPFMTNLFQKAAVFTDVHFGLKYNSTRSFMDLLERGQTQHGITMSELVVSSRDK
jgi:hypothetical protein